MGSSSSPPRALPIPPPSAIPGAALCACHPAPLRLPYGPRDRRRLHLHRAAHVVRMVRRPAARPRARARQCGGGATPRAHPQPQPSPARHTQIDRQAGAGMLFFLLCVNGAGRPPTRWSRCSCSSARSSSRARRGSTRRSPTGPMVSRRRAMPSAAWRRSTGGRCEPTIGHVGPVRLRLSRVFAAAFAAVVAAVHLTTGLRF